MLADEVLIRKKDLFSGYYSTETFYLSILILLGNQVS
ncbi:hypothetical protein Bcell_3548 [Evansella cellulosilytica DSM 2522]|uniref:Uncharacterized protein n=1 Tax=Evansella cellulosilytica (strain ATCC 21833 / DSM 2522 / FERM P-1141 / JCM 9156 / N-4) TaxID=649639 RepID=E6TRF9_EVAC2|nr:hypothetical protein Bcell_3548 [Evansella cellulosilytica DSM 2522]